jgi:signal transduction histidine kinase
MVARRSSSDSPDPSSFEALRDALAEREAEIVELRHQIASMATDWEALLADAAHAIRSPLTLITSYLEILNTDLREGLSEEQASFLSIACENSAKLHRLLDDIVDLAALEIGTARVESAPADLGRIIASVIANLEPKAEQQGLCFRAEVASDLPLVSVDAARLEDSLRRLIENALRFTPEGGSILVEAREEPGQVVIVIRDTGCGIPLGRIDEALRPFAQLHRRPGENRDRFGLGLPLSQRQIEAFGGTFVLKSEVGEGTTVMVTIPASG